MLDSIAIDTHTHTVLSGHAWSTLSENAAAAKRLGLYGICLTEHGPAIPGGSVDYVPAAQLMLPDFVDGVRVYRGTEANIIDFSGSIDIEPRFMNRTEFSIASNHDLVGVPGTAGQNTEAAIGALRHPFIDMLGHIDDAKVPVEFEPVVLAAAELGKIIEINNNSLAIRRGSQANIRVIAGLCMRHGVRVAVSSDAHFCSMIGNVGPALRLLAEIGFPDELVVNRAAASFEAYLAERTERLRTSGSIRMKKGKA